MRAREFERFKKILGKLREELDSEMGRIEKNLLHQNRKESTGEVSSYTTHPADMGSETAEYEKAYLLASQGGELLMLIEEALRRIDDGSYGKCIECGIDIPLERLMAIPYTPYCVECKESLEKGSY